MLRLILALLFAVIFLIASIPVLVIEWILRKINRYAADISSLRIIQCVFKIIAFICGVKLTVIGEENVPKDEAVLYVGNHRSYFDIILTYARCPRLTGYVAKDVMGKVPLLNIWMKRLYCLFLDRKDMKKGLKTILTGVDQIKNGISMCIFPEGTRNRTEEEMLPFKGGSLKMAEKTGCPIVPMAITNSAEILENHIPKIRPARVIIQYGAPIRLEELSAENRKHLSSYVQNEVHRMLQDNLHVQ